MKEISVWIRFKRQGIHICSVFLHNRKSYGDYFRCLKSRTESCWQEEEQETFLSIAFCPRSQASDQTDAIAWVENYRNTKLGSYSEDVARMGLEMKFFPYDEDAETTKYPLEDELYTSMSELTPTLEQIEQLDAISKIRWSGIIVEWHGIKNG